MVPAHSHKVPRVSWYSGSCRPSSVFAYGAFTLSGRSFQDRSANSWRNLCSPNPGMHAFRFGLFRFRSPLLPESSFLSRKNFSFFSSGYLDVSVHRVPSVYLFSLRLFSKRYIRFPYVGSPIQISADQCVFATPRSFSQLITSFIGSQCQGIRPAPFFA